jgi:signal recognition particle subunit SRP54
MATSHDITLDDLHKHLVSLQKREWDDLCGHLSGQEESREAKAQRAAATDRVTRIIEAMTPEERRDPARIGGPALQRIAATAGTQPHEVEDFLRKFKEAGDLMRRMLNTSVWERVQLLLGRTLFPRLPPS